MLAMLAWIISQLITLVLIALLIVVVSSWLISFGIINPHNNIVNAILRICYAVTDPLLRPIRRIMPDLGGIDISPIFVFIGLRAIQIFILSPIIASGGRAIYL